MRYCGNGDSEQDGGEGGGVRDFERKEMRKTGFHDREGEIKEIMNILNTEPTLITFIYGPINSGKTELINHLVKQLPENFCAVNSYQITEILCVLYSK